MFRNRPTTCGNRAQTSIDLLLSIVIFFAAIGLLIGQSPGIFTPGGVGASDTTMTSDRISQELIENDFSKDGATTMNTDDIESFFVTASDDDEFLENRFNLEENRGMKIEISVNKTNDDREMPRVFDEDDSELDESVITVNDNESVIEVESSNFDESGSSAASYGTLDDRQIRVTVSVGRPL